MGAHEEIFVRGKHAKRYADTSETVKDAMLHFKISLIILIKFDFPLDVSFMHVWFFFQIKQSHFQ